MAIHFPVNNPRLIAESSVERKLEFEPIRYGRMAGFYLLNYMLLILVIVFAVLVIIATQTFQPHIG